MSFGNLLQKGQEDSPRTLFTLVLASATRTRLLLYLDFASRFQLQVPPAYRSAANPPRLRKTNERPKSMAADRLGPRRDGYGRTCVGNG